MFPGSFSVLLSKNHYVDVQMSACPLLDRVTMINTTLPQSAPDHLITTHPSLSVMTVMANQNGVSSSVPSTAQASANGDNLESPANLERDYYGCYCLKFIVKTGSHITEEKVLEDFGQFGEVVDVRGPGLFSGLRGNHVYVRFIDKVDAEEALKHLSQKYYQLTPASISDVLPDNYGLYTISFYNKTGIPSSEVRKEFSKFGEVKNLTGSLDVKGGRVFVSYKEKTSAVQALQAFFFRKDKYPNMKFALPRCEKDYFGCYCLKFYNKSGDVTEEKVLKDFGQFGEVVDVRGPGLFDVTGDDVYVRYKEKSSAEQALIELVGKYDSLCLAPPSDIQADKFGYYTITFVNDKCLSKSDVWYIFSKFGTVACVNGTFDCKKGRVFVSYKEKQGALNALETMLITKEYHLQVSKNSTVRKNDYNVANSSSKDTVGANPGGDTSCNNGQIDAGSDLPLHSSRFEKSSQGGRSQHHLPNGNCDDGLQKQQHLRTSSLHRTPPHHRENSRTREGPLLPIGAMPPPGSVNGPISQQVQLLMSGEVKSTATAPSSLSQIPPIKNNGVVKFNRNVEKDIFGYYCLSFLNEDGDISEKKVRHDFGKFGEVVSVRGALGKQKGHVFVRFRKKEAAENCLNCLNSFPLSEMSELFGKYLFLSPATPRDIDCDMYGLYSISFLNLNIKSFREIRQEFSKFGEIVRLTSGGGGNTDELVSISYTEKSAAIKALQTHFTNKEYPYLDIAKGSSLLLVNSSDSSDNEENESDYLRRRAEPKICAGVSLPPPVTNDPFHDPLKNGAGSSDVVDELLKPLQSYFSIYRTGQYTNPLEGVVTMNRGADHFNGQRSPEKKYRIKSVKNGMASPQGSSENGVPFSCPPPPVMSNGTSVASAMVLPISIPPPSLIPEQNCPSQSLPSPERPEGLDAEISNSGDDPLVEDVDDANDEVGGEPIDHVTIEPDVFGLYSLAFMNRSKELTERKVRLDFGKYGDVTKVRGQLNSSTTSGGTEAVVVSYSHPDECRRAASHPALRAKYPSLISAPPMSVVPDRDGHYSIEFVNSGMNGIREITNAFSRHGEVMKVMAGGAKNAPKRVTVSYSDRDAAFNALKANANSKEFLSVDFARECIFIEDHSS